MSVLLFMAERNAAEAMNGGAKSAESWQQIDWQAATIIVKNLQARIVQAVPRTAALLKTS